MSDTREAAQDELIKAGMASGMDDTLGVSRSALADGCADGIYQSSFATSFAVPPPPPKAAPAPEPEQKHESTAPASTEPEEELEDWRPEYEARLKAWQEESAIAREKAEKTRARIEKQREEERKAAQGSDAKAEKQRKEAEARKAKLQEELEGRKVDAKKAVTEGSAKDQAERGQKVKEAWEMVKKAGEPSDKEVTTDGLGVTPNDTNVHIAGETKAPIQPVSYFFCIKSDTRLCTTLRRQLSQSLPRCRTLRLPPPPAQFQQDQPHNLASLRHRRHGKRSREVLPPLRTFHLPVLHLMSSSTCQAAVTLLAAA
jgi:hypothetical protein